MLPGLAYTAWALQVLSLGICGFLPYPEQSMLRGSLVAPPTTSRAQITIPGSKDPRDSPLVVFLAIFPCEDLFQGLPQSWARPTRGQGSRRPCTSLKAGLRLGSWSPGAPVGSMSLPSALLGAGLQARGGCWVQGATGRWATWRQYCPPTPEPGQGMAYVVLRWRGGGVQEAGRELAPEQVCSRREGTGS